MDTFQFGVSLCPAGVSWPELRAAARLIDELGFDSLWTSDHFIADAPARDRPVHESWTVVSAWAALTQQVRLGVLVSGVTHRHPAVMAKMVATLDHISGGRAIIGLGAGWNAS